MPDVRSLVTPILSMLADGGEHALRDIRATLAQNLGLSEADLEADTPGRPSVFQSRLAGAIRQLQVTKLVDRPSRGVYKITDRGRKRLTGKTADHVGPDRPPTAMAGRRLVLNLLADPARRSSLSKLDAAGLDLSSDAIEREVTHFRSDDPDGDPPGWYSERTSGVNFAGCELSGARLENSKVWRGDFTGAVLRDAHFEHADAGVCDFEWADVSGADLSGATLSRASFRHAKLRDTRFTGADLRDADFTGATLERVRLAEAMLGSTRIKRTQITGQIAEERERDYAGATSAYAALKVNFRGLGHFEDASWAYMQERRMETKSLAPWRLEITGVQPIERLTQALRWVGATMTGLIAGYGERPLRALLWVPAIVVAYALLYWRVGDLTADGTNPAGFAPCLRHSLASFVTLSVAETPKVYPLTSGGQVWTSIEAMTGISLLALVMFSLGKRITRS
jgi:uncharacterized protein YjbI with pentapeptide repeats